MAKKKLPPLVRRDPAKPPPKFAKLGNRITRLVRASDDPGYEAEVDRLAADYKKRGLTVMEMSAQYDALKEQKDKLEEKIKALNPHIGACERLICETLLEDGQTSCRLSNGVQLIVQEPLVVKVKDQALFIEWLDKHHPEWRDLMSMHWQTLNTQVKLLHESGEELPSDDVLGLYFRQSLQRRKGKAQ